MQSAPSPMDHISQERPLAQFTDVRRAISQPVRSMSQADMEVAAMDNQASATQQSDVEAMMLAIGQMQQHAQQQAQQTMVAVPAHILTQLVNKPKDYITIWMLVGGFLCITVAAIASVMAAIDKSPSQQMVRENAELRAENARLSSLVASTASKAMKQRSNCFGWCPGQN